MGTKKGRCARPFGNTLRIETARHYFRRSSSAATPITPNPINVKANGRAALQGDTPVEGSDVTLGGNVGRTSTAGTAVAGGAAGGGGGTVATIRRGVAAVPLGKNVQRSSPFTSPNAPVQAVLVFPPAAAPNARWFVVELNPVSRLLFAVVGGVSPHNSVLGTAPPTTVPASVR